MARQKRSNPLFQFLLGVMLSLLIIAGAVTFTLHFRPLYYLDISLLRIETLSGLDKAVIIRNYDALIDYNNLFNHQPLAFPDFVMSEAGRIHFEEVKVVFDLFGYLTIFLLPLVLIGIWIANRTKSRAYLRVAGILGILIPVSLAVCIGLWWDRVFVIFHELVFNNDYWIFDEKTDPVITILPDTFFMHCAIMILAIVFLGSILCLIFSRRKKKRRI